VSWHSFNTIALVVISSIQLCAVGIDLRPDPCCELVPAAFTYRSMFGARSKHSACRKALCRRRFDDTLPADTRPLLPAATHPLGPRLLFLSVKGNLTDR
jgi:hypothetical protein